MTPTPSQELTVERDAIARATEAFLAGGGQVQSLPNNLGPLRNMTWQEENESRWQAKQRGDSPPKAEPRPRPLKRKRAVKIADEHGIDLPLYPRKGTKQARKNAELREEWE